MERILDGTPQYSNGALTILVGQRLLELGNLRAETELGIGGGPAFADAAVELVAQVVVALAEGVAGNPGLGCQGDDRQIAQLHADTTGLLRTLNQLTAENDRLRRSHQLPAADVIPLRPRTEPAPGMY